MGAFQTRKIRRKPPLQVIKKVKGGLTRILSRFQKVGRPKVSYLIGFILVLLGVAVVFKVTFGLYAWIRDFDVTKIATVVGSDLEQDKNGYINLVLLGDGGHVRDGADLVDTIMVVSIDPINSTASLLSIPRDYYIKGNGIRAGKINELYRSYKREMGEEAFSMFAKAAGELTDLAIPYYARVDFNGFVEVVDGLGGITVDVKEDLYDPYYPNETDDGYTVFEVKAGMQEMNGEIALKYARSRKTTSDFDRAHRQQLVLNAIREKVMSSEVLTNPKTIKKLYKAVQNNLNTNLTLRQIISLASWAKNFDRNKILMKVLHDDPSREGGFLYTPERQYYNNQFVLIPIGDNFNQIHQYSNLVFHYRDFFLNPAKIEVLNATKLAGVARLKAEVLKRFGFQVVSTENWVDKQGQRKTIEKSFIRYNQWKADKDGNVIPQFKSTLGALSGFALGEALPSDELTPNDKVDISVIVGEDGI